jgi:hypothetical protein
MVELVIRFIKGRSWFLFLGKLNMKKLSFGLLPCSVSAGAHPTDASLKGKTSWN